MIHEPGSGHGLCEKDWSGYWKKARIVISGVWSRHIKIVSNDRAELLLALGEARNEVIIDHGDERGFEADGVPRRREARHGFLPFG